MTNRIIDENNQVVVSTNEATSATLTSSFNAVGRKMMADSEFMHIAEEAVDEYRKGAIRPVQSSADLV